MGLTEVTGIIDIIDILQIYYRYIIDILPQITVDYGGLRWKTVDYNKRCHRRTVNLLI